MKSRSAGRLTLLDRFDRCAGSLPPSDPLDIPRCVGSGRVALPLSRNGVRVVGIDASEAMLAKLRVRQHTGFAVG